MKITSRYFNKNKAFLNDLSDHANGNGSTNGKAFGVATSSADDSNKNKSVAELDNFAFNRTSNMAKRPIESLEDDKDVILTKIATVTNFQQGNGNKRWRRYQIIEDSDDDDLDKKGSFGGNHTTREGAVECADDEALAKRVQNMEYQPSRGRSRQVQLLLDSDEEEEEEVNLITITLQRCDLIAASLREELYTSGSSENAINKDCYAEVDVAAAKIVSLVR